MQIVPECCNKCLRITITNLGVLTHSCEAFKELQENCTNAQYSKRDRLKELRDLELYYRNKGQNGNKTYVTIKKQIKELKSQVSKEDADHIKEALLEDKRRGEPGGGEKQKGNTTGIKQRMKDNRPQDNKLTREQREAYQEAVNEFEEKHGKLPQHKSIGYGINRSNIDSYTGDEIKEEK